MQDEFTEVWDQSRAYYAAHLSERDRVRMGVIRSQQDLINYARTLEVKYSAAQVVRGLKRTQTIIAQLNSFASIINIFVQNSDVAGFVWGPLALILEVCCSAVRRTSCRTETCLLLYNSSSRQPRTNRRYLWALRTSLTAFSGVSERVCFSRLVRAAQGSLGGVLLRIDCTLPGFDQIPASPSAQCV